MHPEDRAHRAPLWRRLAVGKGANSASEAIPNVLEVGQRDRGPVSTTVAVAARAQYTSESRVS